MVNQFIYRKWYISKKKFTTSQESYHSSTVLREKHIHNIEEECKVRFYLSEKSELTETQTIHQ